MVLSPKIVTSGNSEPGCGKHLLDLVVVGHGDVIGLGAADEERLAREGLAADVGKLC
jgi:hypothetical protein